MTADEEKPMLEKRFNLIGIQKILLSPTKQLHQLGMGASSRALFGVVATAATKKSGHGLVEFLKQVQLFEDLHAGDLRRLSRVVHERSYRDGESIFEQGKPSAALFVIRTGVIEIIVRGHNGEDVQLAMLEPPASLGETELLGGEAMRWCSARARGPVSIVALGRSDLEALSQNFPIVANKVLAKLAQIAALRLQLLVEQLTSEEQDSE
jgi:CRP-like cAMP-binding protein